MYDCLRVVNRYRSSKLLSFWKIAFLQCGDRQTNKQTNKQTSQTDKQMDTPVALSRSRCRERRLNNDNNNNNNINRVSQFLVSSKKSISHWHHFYLVTSYYSHPLGGRITRFTSSVCSSVCLSRAHRWLENGKHTTFKPRGEVFHVRSKFRVGLTGRNISRSKGQVSRSLLAEKGWAAYRVGQSVFCMSANHDYVFLV